MVNECWLAGCPRFSDLIRNIRCGQTLLLRLSGKLMKDNGTPPSDNILALTALVTVRVKGATIGSLRSGMLHDVRNGIIMRHMRYVE